MNTKATLAVTALICLVVGGAAGYAGASKFSMMRRGGFAGQRPGNFAGMRGQTGQMPGMGRVVGSVQSLADGRMTVQTANNSSQIILINGSTMYQKEASAAAGDVTTGTRVLVTGTKNPDGSTTAASIQIIPN